MFDVLILGVTDASHDPRLHRQIESLKGKYRIAVMANAAPNDTKLSFFPRKEASIVGKRRKSFLSCIVATRNEYGFVQTLLLLVRSVLIRSIALQWLSLLLDRFFYRRLIVKQIERIPSKMILANDLSALSIAVWASKGRPVIFDAHEYYPGQFPRTSATLYRRKYDFFILKHFLPKCGAVSTVGEGIARLYKRMYSKDLEIVMNAPEYVALKPSTSRESIRFVHHGAAIRGRNLENLLEAFSRLGKGHTFDLYLVGDDEGYLGKLKKLASEIPGVTFYPAVPMPSLARVLNSYDVGLYALPTTTLNQKWALPNKVFEFVQARLAMVIGPSPEMAVLVKKHNLGIVADGFDAESLARAMGKLTTQEIQKYKHNADRASFELSSEPQKEKILKMVSKVLIEQSRTLPH